MGIVETVCGGRQVQQEEEGKESKEEARGGEATGGEATGEEAVKRCKVEDVKKYSPSLRNQKQTRVYLRI